MEQIYQECRELNIKTVAVHQYFSVTRNRWVYSLKIHQHNKVLIKDEVECDSMSELKHKANLILDKYRKKCKKGLGALL